MLRHIKHVLGQWQPFAKIASQHNALPEKKDSAVKSLIALGLRDQPIWTPRQYDQLAREGFMKNAIAYRCIRMIAEACASVPLRVEHEGAVATKHPLKALLDRPNAEQSRAAFFESLFGALQTSGNAYIEASENLLGEIEGLWCLRSDRTKVIANKQGWPEAFEYQVGTVRTRIGRNEEGWLKVLHLKFFHPLDDWYGFSPLEAAAFSIDVHNASGAWNKALLDNAARPSGALVYGNGSDRLSAEQVDRLKSDLTDAYAGAANAGRPLLLEGGLDWKPMALTPSEMDFIEGKNAAARDIALCFGVPAQLLGIPGDNSYANYKEANLAFWRHTVLPLVERTVQALNGWLSERFDGARIRADLEALPALTAERDSLWARLENASFLSVEERRKLAGLSAVPEGEITPIQEAK